MKPTFLLLWLTLSCSGDTVLREVNRTGVKQKGIAIDSSAFTLTHLERVARSELASKPRSNFIQLVMYGENGGAPLPKPSELTYAHWRNFHNSSAQFPNNIAEMIAIGNDAVLRMREANGRITKRVIEGRDPLQIEVGGMHCEILYLSLAAPSASILQRTNIYIRTDSDLNPEMGLMLLRKLQPIFPEMELFLAIRKDPWFVFEPNYPFSNPFIEELNPPTAADYAKTKTLKCGRASGAPSCVVE